MPNRITQDVALVGGLGIDGGVATGVAGAATLNKRAGKVTTETLNVAAAALYTHTISIAGLSAVDIVLVTVAGGTGGVPAVVRVTPAANSVAVQIQNIHASVALTGTLVISFTVVDQ